ncbi:unnamed protein product [Rotaria magnacalcarata]|uniref:BED-type domain-containing protein n=2 Tax=Rotaria magnacalcarata TaxID=392030 RepID=A0A816UQ15_9BILA|nr:unnamed protein product [Rotaria magnacalcarata]
MDTDDTNDYDIGSESIIGFSSPSTISNQRITSSSINKETSSSSSSVQQQSSSSSSAQQQSSSSSTAQQQSSSSSSAQEISSDPLQVNTLIPTPANHDLNNSEEYVNKNESSVWNFAVRSNDNQTAKCKICSIILKTTNWSTTGLRKHMEQVHKIPMVKSTSTTAKSTISTSFKSELHNLVVNAIIQDSRSFDDFRRPGMTNFLKKAIPGYVPPHRATVARRLKRLNVLHHRRLQEDIQHIKKISITLDFWSDRTMKSFLCITGHYCTYEFDYVSTILSFNAFYDRHQGVRIAKIVKEKLNELNAFQKLQCLTTDGARNMVTMYQNLTSNKFDWIWCIAHRLHLVVTNALGFWPVKKKKKDDETSNTHNKNNNDDNENDIDYDLTIINNLEDNEDTETIWDDATQDQSSELANHSEVVDETEDVDEMDISDENTLHVAQSENDDDTSFIDFVTNNNLINDNWAIDVSINEDDNNLDKQEIYVLIKKCRAFVNVTKKSSILSNYFDQLRFKYSVTRGASGDCITRWNSTFHLIESILILKSVIIKFFDDKYTLNLRRELVTKLISIELQNNDWQLLGHLQTVLRPFHLATQLMSGRSYPTIGLCYYTIRNVHVFLSKDEDDSYQVKSLKRMLLIKFQHYYFSDDEQIKLLKVSKIMEEKAPDKIVELVIGALVDERPLYSFFDPNGYCVLNENDIRLIENQIKDLVKNEKSFQDQVLPTPSMSTNFPSSSSKNKPKSSTFDQFLIACGQAEVTIEPKINNKKLTINEELKLYKKTMIEFCSNQSLTATSSLEFWKKNFMHLPILSDLARGYLSTPGTSIASESAFSVSSYVNRKERARLSADNLCFTMFLKDKITPKN